MGNALGGEGWETKDSGKRQEFDSGARRDVQEGKGRYDLMSPYAQARKAGIYERGAVKYGDRNFEKGMPLSRFLDSAERHIAQFKMGNVDEDHLGQAAWNLDALMHTQALIELGLVPAELDDLPDYVGRAAALYGSEMEQYDEEVYALEPLDQAELEELLDDPEVKDLLSLYYQTPTQSPSWQELQEGGELRKMYGGNE